MPFGAFRNIIAIGVRSDIISSEYVNSKNIELVAVKVQLSKQKPLIVGSYYRPPNRTDNEYVNNSINELSEICTGSNNVTVWIGGDFNLSDISWPSGNITSSNHTKKLNRSFLDTSTFKKRLHSFGPIVRRAESPKVRESEGPIVRLAVSPKGRKSEGPISIVQRSDVVWLEYSAGAQPRQNFFSTLCFSTVTQFANIT